MRRSQYTGRVEIIPSEQALIILESTVRNISLERLMLLAHSGSHNLNPYHNTLHELQNVYYSFSCFQNDSTLGDKGPQVADLVQAALFHDHNHSGGVVTDDKNIERAVDFVQRELIFKDPASNIIRCTQFLKGEFPVEPTNLAERCIRDADLMTIYSQEGFRLMLGLFEEMSKKPLNKFSESEVRDALKNTWNFLTAQKMYTDHGNRMRDEHLASQVKKFCEFVWQRFKYETEFRGSTQDV